MTDDLEQRLRALRPAPMPTPVRWRIAAAVRAAPPRPHAALAWVPALAAALGVVVLALAQPAAPRPGGGGSDDTMPSYGVLARRLGAPAELLEAIDHDRRPIPRFAAFDPAPPARNRP